MTGALVRNIVVVGSTCIVIFVITTAIPQYHESIISLIGSFLLPLLYGAVVFSLVKGETITRFLLVAITPILYFSSIWIFGYLREIHEISFIVSGILIFELMMLIGAGLLWISVEKFKRKD